MLRLLFTFLVIPSFLSAQQLPSIEEKTKDSKKQEGFLDFYWEESTGKIFLAIKLDTEILYQQSLPAGLGSNDIGLDRGLLGDTRIIKFSKVGRKILMIEPNYAYRAVTKDANEKRAVEQSFARRHQLEARCGCSVDRPTRSRRASSARCLPRCRAADADRGPAEMARGSSRPAWSPAAWRTLAPVREAG